MARSSSDTRVREAFVTAGLTRRQQSLLHTVLRALDNGSALGFHAATSDSALVALIRAHDALQSHIAHDQPQGRQLLRVLRTSAVCVRAALPGFPARAGLRAALHELEATTEALTANPLQRPDTSALESWITDIAKAVEERLGTLWDARAVDLGKEAKAAAEIAVSVYLRGRDADALKHDLTNLLAKGRPDAAAISALLWPTPRRHYLTVLVSGARSLDELDDLLPGARQWPITANQEPSTALLAKLEPITRAGVLVRVPVDAADLGTAVVLGRRAISEALDQYVAGNRVADLTLEGPWQVTGPDEKPVLGEPAKASVKRAAPLSASRSEGLRAALRIAHIAQRVEAPMTSAALCWNAIESTGLLAEKSSRLARACAMQVLRQQVIDAHTQLRLMVAEELRRLAGRARKAKDALKRAENALGRTVEVIAAARQAWLDSAAAHQRAVDETTALMALVDAHVPMTSGKPALIEPDRWLDLLLPPRAGRQSAWDAVTALAAFAGGLAEENVELWRERLARPPLLAKWLQDKQDTCHALLEWLYTTRNIAFHHGRFAGPVDVATAHAGRAVVDMMLEILGRWHSIQHARGQDLTPPEEIFSLLARRKDALSAVLHKANSCHQLSIQHITGPDETSWVAPRPGSGSG
ncbi:hypothetical protein [Allokutzneria sp. NRRL B-24872]|uniref:hypothetical protein n=1 Tax=Allokutzneria sp. NRRL B-24872 TaxID=1137961 RepID=UPI001178A4C6|nr:hypothetical protein [Allokutzneria sp. NRRL B-24872]